MTADVVYLVAGGCLLLAIVLPELLSRWAISAPIVLVGLGMLIGLTPLPDGLPLDPQDNRVAIEHITELVVLVALMGVGLAIDRPLQVRKLSSWKRWAPTWRLLAIGMPVTIGAVALLGVWAGLAPAAALLLGAALAPTDPVLASDVQVAGPRTHSEQEEGAEGADEEDEVRFALTSEAGLNDGLAFPFVYAAILLATEGGVGSWGLQWLGWYLIAKVALGVVAGIVVGRLLSYVAFRSASKALRVAERGESLLSLAALVASYGVGQVIGGYGFLSVFVCAMTFRTAERDHDYHAAMHDVAERLERLLTLFVLLVLGIALTRGLLDALDWRGIAIGLALVLVVRPVAGLVALLPWAMSTDTGGLRRGEQWAVAFFGVRGVGSLFYLAYASGYDDVLAQDWLWSTVAFTIVLSVVVHGVTSTPVMARLTARTRALEPVRS